jgi:predicted aminopeptidase
MGAIPKNARQFAHDVRPGKNVSWFCVRFPRFRTTVVLLSIAAAISSCRTTKFYTQAIRGQWEVLSRSRPIEEVRADPATSSEVREKLGLVEELRTFARVKLKLPTERQFRNYADLGRKYVVWNVVAAPEFSLKAKTWSYPFLGDLKYRGFFSEEAAREEGARVKAQGYDVAIGGVRVYSTLGVFSDPVLNTFILEDDASLADTLFHELTHARLYLSGDTDFNEAYATASAQLGVRAWLRQERGGPALAKYERSLEQSSRLLNVLKDTRQDLEALYARRDSMTQEDMRRAKAVIFEGISERYAASARAAPPPQAPHSKWVNGNLNNARLAALATYHDLVPGFIQLFYREGDDWERFHRAVAAMKPMSKQERRKILGVSDAASPTEPEIGLH